jgi:toxin-antitoxin system PIN domain toxin
VKKRPALLDVNVLIALFDETHVHHLVAHDWFADHRKLGWATCPLTENGFLRVLTHPRAGVVDDYARLLEHFRSFCGGAGHVFWSDSVSLTDERLFDPAVIVSHRQLTDVYLLGLARKMRGTLATFDTRIPMRAVRGATATMLSIIAPAA